MPAAEVHDFKRAVSRCAPRGLRQASRSRHRMPVKQPKWMVCWPAHQSNKRNLLLTDELVLLESTSQTKEEVIQEMVDAFYVSEPNRRSRPVGRSAVGARG